MSDAAPYAIYVQHLRAGRLAYQFSAAAQRPVFFPRVVSPYDHEETLEWRISSGLGIVHSVTTVFPRDGEPYNIAIVECDEGFRLMTRIEQCPADRVRIGLRVTLSVHTPAADRDPYPMFVPAETA
jgi:uncharacterized protein